MDNKKIEENKIFYHLNTLGIEFKKDTLGKPVSDILSQTRYYFCTHFCKYSPYCSGIIEESRLPWCPCEELK